MFDPGKLLPTSVAEIEAIQNMRFVPPTQMEAPSYLYQRADGSTKIYLRSEYRPWFEHSASSSLLAYIPLYFWRQVLHETNKYAVTKAIQVTTPFSLNELMAFIGILFFIAMNTEGKYANYWDQ